MPKGEKIYRLKRGFLNAKIIAMSFSHNSTLFAITSSRGTLHIYQLERSSQQTVSTAPMDLEEEQAILQGKVEKYEDLDDNPGCNAWPGLCYIFSKLTGAWCCTENGSCQASILMKIIKNSKFINKTAR